MTSLKRIAAALEAIATPRPDPHRPEREIACFEEQARVGAHRVTIEGNQRRLLELQVLFAGLMERQTAALESIAESLKAT